MIAISEEGGYITIAPMDESGLRVLRSPLHRVYMRGELQGVPGEHGQTWYVPFDPRDAGLLERLVNHFHKYGIETRLDSSCQAILQGMVKARQAYDVVLEAGRKAKHEGVSDIRRTLTDKLKQGFQRQLTALQMAALNHLLTVRNGANFSVPGSGKTSIALAYYHVLKEQGIVDALFVIGPGSCFEPWEHEYGLCFGRKASCIRLAGNPKHIRREQLLLAEQYEILLTTYHSTVRDADQIAAALKRRRYLLVLDESHYIKRPQGGKIAESVLTIAPYAERRIILTGTPMPNGLADLWSQFTFLWHDQLPLGKAETYLYEIEDKGNDRLLNDVQRRISPLFFRITKQQLHLPRPTFHVMRVPLSNLQERIYRGVAARFLSQAAEQPEDREALREWRRARAIRLLQIASNPTLLRQRCEAFLLPPMDLGGISLDVGIEHYAKYEIPAKIALVERIVDKICSAGDKVIVWSTFVHNLLMLAKALERWRPVVIHGGVPLASSIKEDLTREHLIAEFKSNPECKLFIGNPAACAESISLHMVCHHAVYLDRSFNCAHYLQSLDRIHRLGLAADVRTNYYVMVASDTVDEVVHHRLTQKMSNMRRVVESGLPGEIPGYWGEDLGDEEITDFDMVEDHIRRLFELGAGEAR